MFLGLKLTKPHNKKSKRRSLGVKNNGKRLNDT